MEQGTLSIIQTKSGKFIARVTFTKSDGKQGVIDAQFWSPSKDDLKYNDTPCEFQREKGALVKLKTNDGRVIEKTAAPPQAATDRHQNTGGRSTYSDGIADSYDPALTLLPADTKNALTRIDPDNFALKWQKAARHVEGSVSDKNKFMFFKRDRKGENFEIRPNFGKIDFEQIANRELTNAKAILGDNAIKSVEFDTQWRMVQGLGIESVYETSMTLHHVYGIPYIPASALKGVVRSWIIVNAYGGKEETAISDPRFCDWFGCPGELVLDEILTDAKDGKRKKRKYSSHYKEARKGELMFFDAYPLNVPRLKTDVMNPHYGPYYSDKTGNTPPADYHNPVPVFFLTVEETPFRFILGANKETLGQILKDKTVFDWLKDALQNHGIGAKTAVGYGYMKSV
jgi:CRISPR-associated protein Cmr6